MRLTAKRFQQLVQAHLDGLASEADIAILEEYEDDWARTLERLLREADAALERVRVKVTGPERSLVLADFQAERDRIAATLTALTGDAGEEEADEEPPEPGVPQLQLSWTPGHVVAWAAGAGADAEPADAVLTRLRAAGAPDAWQARDPIKLPDGSGAETVGAPIQSTLGWVVTLASTADDDALGAGATWLGMVATLAVRLAAQGRMVPQLERVSQDAGEGSSDGSRQAQGGRSTFAVSWAPALIDAEELAELARSLPGTVAVLDSSAGGRGPQDARAFTVSVVGDFLDAICRDAAARVEVPAPPPDPRSEQEMAETFLARLDGTAFEAPTTRGTEMRRGLQSWAKVVTATSNVRLIVQLGPPDEGDAWHLRTMTSGAADKVERVDAAMSNASPSRREVIKRELDRLETLFPALLRSKGRRRGEVILSQDEAWQLMTSIGADLVAAGFEVRVPPLSRRKPSPGLRLTSMEAQESVVGAQQLTSVRWSAVFDDLELTAQDITRLAAEARPLVKVHGRWVELDHADLDAAAAALAERADRTRLTGADMLRHALGLDGPSLPGGISVAGEGWAADLVRSAAEISGHLPTQPPGFVGELRGYQANALAWLQFLDGAGLGGCLALDMGLGKTPIMLAHLRATTDQGPALVIVPPAVVGNWAAEARRFVPDLRVVVHHGSNRADHSDIAQEVASADIILTTYGTAVRDIAALEEIDWSKLVLDEAQVIKNPTSDTAQQLRRLNARNRVALTGTPIENGLGDLWALLDFTNPGLVGARATFVAQLSRSGEGRSSAEQALRTLNGVLVFRRTKAEPAIAAELPDRIDVLDRCPMTAEQIGLYQAVLDRLVADTADDDGPPKKGAVLTAITGLKQICNHPAAYADGEGDLEGRSGKLARAEEIVGNVFAAGERVLIFTHFASWGEKLAGYLTARTGVPISCYHGGLSRAARDRMIREFQEGEGAGALVLSLKAGGTGLNLTAASHVVLYDRWWNPAVEDQARDRAWRIGQTKTVVCHRLVCPGTVDERVEEVVAGKRRIADLVLPESSSVDDLHSDQLRAALGIDPDALLTEEVAAEATREGAAA
ncbi:MAG TPA: DEAD/DEAH box helicase [Egibacteraceae bacterium]|nr:DEAD/DEAH box helicase [Egibacteraceae bacterium]